MSMYNFKHGHTRNRRETATYKVWCNMKSRCGVRTAYLHIGYDPSWESFDQFLADMGEKPDGLTIDRVDNSKGYSKENCRWSTVLQQNRNRSIAITVELNGERMSLMEAANRLGAPYITVYSRYKNGRPVG